VRAGIPMLHNNTAGQSPRPTPFTTPRREGRALHNAAGGTAPAEGPRPAT
jgi:glutathione-regulated potassium-efflux system protein KefB